jgi:glutaredoxin
MNPVKMYTTQVCPYCVRAKALLKQRGVEQIEEIRVSPGRFSTKRHSQNWFTRSANSD